ncbi:MAG: amino acid permease [Bryobacterales bacterium]|nr:amino acid permease [Bryobacterales bacterium]
MTQATPTETTAAKPQLVRGLTFISTTALVIGSIIGTGIFFKAAVMSQQVGSPMLVLAAWVAAGLLSLAGALTYAELGGMMPHAGGEYLYVRTAYGDVAGFLNGWMRCVVAAGGMSALGVGFATFLSAVIPMPQVWAHHTLHLLGREIQWQFGLKEVVAVAVILLLGGLNCAGIAFSGNLQSLLTAGKILGIGIIVMGVFLFSGGGSPEHFRAPASAPQWTGVQVFGAAMLSALWAYDGWTYMPMVAGEVKDPERNLARSLILGVVVVLALYGLANVAYFWALPFHEILTANSTAHRDALPVAAKAAGTFLGSHGPAIMSFLFMLSVAGALNAVILSTARIPFTMAHDSLLPAQLGHLHPRSLVPVWAIIAISVWASILALSGTFDQLTDMSMFASWAFYALAASSVFVLRKRAPNAPRPYKTWGYPVVPAVFVLTAAWLLVNSLQTIPVESVMGIVLILLGLPVYFFYKRKAAGAPRA